VLSNIFIDRSETVSETSRNKKPKIPNTSRIESSREKFKLGNLSGELTKSNVGCAT
jgi:hypothetical protein